MSFFNMKTILILLTITLVSCASSTLYSTKTGKPLAKFEGNYQRLYYENKEEGVKWSADNVDHATATKATQGTTNALSAGLGAFLLK